ncbi:MAG: hypothetical protein NZM35_04135 [Chitinophagales bacterium]|nr:hypothetical protein [Chitinophagales bacterium]MDW8418460.1 hypothetical protein [Chitinophagales bacterium]
MFYGLFGNPERSGVVGVEISSPLTLLKELFSVQKIRTQINFIAESIIYLLILYFPLIFFLFKRRSLITIRNLPLMFVVILVFVSILLWAIFYYELNSYQIFSNISTPAINVSAIILIISSIDNGVLSCRTRSFYGWGINALVVLTLGVNIINFLKKIEDIKTQKHSYIYLKKIYESIPENELVASLRSSVDMQSMHKKK